MKVRIKVVSLLLIVVMAFGIMGCSKNTDPVTKTNTDNSDNTEATSQEDITLKFTYWGGPNEKTAIEGALKDFEELHQNIKVEAIQIPNSDYNPKLTAMAASNESPDVGYMTTDLGAAWSKEGKFVNLFEQLKKDSELSREDFLDYVWYNYTPDNAWGVSTAGECYGLFYNKDVLAKAGIEDLPTTAETAMNWDEFVEIARKLTLDGDGHNGLDPDFNPENIVQYGLLFETWNDPICNFIISNGGSWTSEDGSELTIVSDEAAEAIQRLADLVNVYHVAPSPIAAKSLPGMNVALENGLTAMAVGGQWINLDLGKANVNYDIGVLPKMKTSVTVGLSGASVVFSDSKHPEEAWELFKYMVNPTGAIDLYKDGLWMPILKEWYEDPELLAKWVDANPAAHPPGFKEAMIDQLLENGVPSTSYYLKNQAKLVPIITSSWDEVWLGNKTAKQALEDVSEMAEAEFQGRYDK
jgi:multiple sugar transport system substrate-binding protein